MRANEAHGLGAGFFSQLPQLVGVAERLPEAFQTGIGLPYDAFGPEGARGVERGLAPWFRALLVPFALPRVGDVVARLRAGAAVADVGCGGGVALLEMAKAYPAPSSRLRHLQARARARRENSTRRRRTSLHTDTRAPMPRRSLQLRTTFDCLHDMTTRTR